MVPQALRDADCREALVSSAVPVMTSDFTTAYADGELDSFFDCPRPPQTARLRDGLNRPNQALAAALAAEAERLGADPAVAARAGRLAHPAARATVTGQQAGLLLGPGYTLAKTASAVQLAARLDEEEAPVVPVFWLASQDHDVAEIDHAWLLDLDERLHRVSVQLPEEVPAGHIAWEGRYLQDIREQLSAGRWEPGHLEAILKLLQEAGGRADTWADFFAAVHYLVHGAAAAPLLDPSRPALAPLFNQVLAAEIRDPVSGVAAINAAGDRLRSLGFEPQLGRGRGATNLFITVTEDGLPRRRLLRFDSGVFHTGTHSFSASDLLAILDAEPGRITPAAGLRPITQDAVLPTSAFVVGPGELRYLAQLLGVYRQHGVAQPTIWPRTHVTILEPPLVRILERHGLTAEEFLAGPDEAERRVLLALDEAEAKFNDGFAALSRSQAELSAALLELDPTLLGTLSRHTARVTDSLRLLREKTAAAIGRREQTVTGQFARLRAHLLPGGVPQERQLSPFSQFLKFGTRAVLAVYEDAPESGSVVKPV